MTLFLISRQIPLGLGQGCLGKSLECEWPTQHRQNSPSQEYHTCKPQICSGGEQHSPASSQTTGTHQQEGYSCRQSLSESLLWCPTGKPLAEAQPGMEGSSDSLAAPVLLAQPHGNAERCPDHGCVSRGETPNLQKQSHTFKTATLLPGSSRVF